MFQLMFDGEIRTRPQLTFANDGTPRCQFRVAHDRRQVLDGLQTRDRPMWITVTAAGALARSCMQLAKGDTVTVTGRDDLGIWAYIRAHDDSTYGVLEVTASHIALSL